MKINEEMIQAMIAEYLRFSDDGDAEGLTAFYTPDAVVTNVDGNWHGHEDIQRMLTEEFDSRLGSITQTEIVDIYWEDGDLSAVVIEEFVTTDGSRRDRGVATMFLTLTESGVRIKNESFVVTSRE